MEFHFSNKNLESLYTTGVCEKYKLEKDVIYDFIWLIGIISAAKDVSDLDGQPSLDLKKSKSQYSFKLSKKHRLRVNIERESEEKTAPTIFINEILNVKDC